MIVDINTKLAAHDAKLEELLPQSANPPDMEDTSAQTPEHSYHTHHRKTAWQTAQSS